jgi:hypothetical protein
MVASYMTVWFEFFLEFEMSAAVAGINRSGFGPLRSL